MPLFRRREPEVIEAEYNEVNHLWILPGGWMPDEQFKKKYWPVDREAKVMYFGVKSADVELAPTDCPRCVKPDDNGGST